MNIFVLDTNPVIAAQQQCNKHVCKMLIESAQLLCNVLLARGRRLSELPYRPTHLNHPCSVWAWSRDENAAWLFAHARALSEEYSKRYCRVHKTSAVLDVIGSMMDPSVDPTGHDEFVQAMPDTYRGPDAVEAYRRYYVGEKSRFARWAPRALPPAWWPFVEQ